MRGWHIYFLNPRPPSAASTAEGGDSRYDAPSGGLQAIKYRVRGVPGADQGQLLSQSKRKVCGMVTVLGVNADGYSPHIPA